MLYLNNVKVLVTQSCLTVCNPMDCSPPGSSVHGILQGTIQEWVATPVSRGLNPGLLHCRQTLYQLSHQGSPLAIFNQSILLILTKEMKMVFQNTAGYLTAFFLREKEVQFLPNGIIVSSACLFTLCFLHF